jgi:hypothetical protein
MVIVYKGLFIRVLVMEVKSKGTVKTDEIAITVAVSVVLASQHNLDQSIGSLIGCQVVEVGMVLGQHRDCKQIDVRKATWYDRVFFPETIIKYWL